MAIHRARSLPSLADLERPIDGYIRVSRVGDRSGESYISPDVQRAVLDAGARAELAHRIAERAFGLGPLEPLLRDPAVDELMVCGTAPVWVERGGTLSRTDVRFAGEAELRHAIERILAPLGRRADEAEPLWMRGRRTRL